MKQFAMKQFASKKMPVQSVWTPARKVTPNVPAQWPSQSIPRPDFEEENVFAGIKEWFKSEGEKRMALDFIKGSREPVLICDERLEITFHNQAWLRCLGHKCGTYRGEQLKRFMAFDDRNRLDRAVTSLRNGSAGGSRSLDFRIPLPGKAELPVSGWLTRRQTSNGTDFFYLSLRADRGPKEDDLRAKQTVELLRNMTTFFWVTDLKNRLITINDRTATYFGIPQGEELANFEMALEFEKMARTDSEGVLANLIGADGGEGWFLLNRQPFKEGARQTGWAFFASNLSGIYGRDQLVGSSPLQVAA